ncbi:hypothetical protein ACJ72_00383 [Emergomyces africanus]|uniref:Major facilitator superfamily (MFS) profile domain-containing protein n=1 Tax=Emergomyces africanus TaxID=1955775 RepID=A0A1B7P8A2_9EURO|nr:hypothetical protein ACJ72_00383 [Emergomyces africanus]
MTPSEQPSQSSPSSSTSSIMEKSSVGDTMADTASTNTQRTPSVDISGGSASFPEQVGDIQHENERNPSDSPRKRELKEYECYEKLGYSFPVYKKWLILAVVFAVQLSMNFNTSVYSNATTQLSEHFNVSMPNARLGQMIFLIAYAFGCELWAPWSEEYGRWSILQASLLLINIWQLPCALAPSFKFVLVGRFLGGLSSAGGSVTLGMTADMWQPNDQGFAVAYVVLSSVAGSSIGPIFGAFIEHYLPWQWIFWVQLIFGVVVQLAHFFLVEETRSSVLLDREAKRRRESGTDTGVYGPNELKKHHLSVKGILSIWTRPFHMFVCEPIVLFLSLLSGFSDALIFTCIESFALVYSQWRFGTIARGLTFVPINIGYIISYLMFLPDIARQRKIRESKGDDSRTAERRLLLVLFLAPLEVIGLFGFAWSTMGPEYNHWIIPMIFTCLIAIANYAIYMGTIDYMVASYGPYAASATGGNGFARDLFAGISAIYARPMYENIGGRLHLQWASTILAILSLLVMIPLFVFYWLGPQIRAKSKFAQTLAVDRQTNEHHRVSKLRSLDMQYKV